MVAKGGRMRAFAVCAILAALAGCGSDEAEEHTEAEKGRVEQIRKEYADKGMKVTSISREGLVVYTDADSGTPEKEPGTLGGGVMLCVLLLMLAALPLLLLVRRHEGRGPRGEDFMRSMVETLDVPTDKRVQDGLAAGDLASPPPQSMRQEAPMDLPRLLRLLEETEDGAPVLVRTVGFERAPKPARIWFYDRLETERGGFQDVVFGVARVRKAWGEDYYSERKALDAITEFRPLRAGEEVPRRLWRFLADTPVLLGFRRPRGGEVCLWLNRVEKDADHLPLLGRAWKVMCYRGGDLSERPNYVSPRPMRVSRVKSLRLLEPT